MKHHLSVHGRPWRFLLAATFVSLVGASAWASSIPIVNHSFEDPADQQKYDLWGDPGSPQLPPEPSIIQGWQPTGPGHVGGDGDSARDYYYGDDGNALLGEHLLVLGARKNQADTDPPIAQTTGHAIAAGERYRLNFWAKDEFTANEAFSALISNQGRVRVEISGPNGFFHVEVVGPFGNSGEGAASAMLPFSVLSSPVPSGQEGGPLTISFQNATPFNFPAQVGNAWSWIFVDNVSLEVVPEPVSWLMMLGGSLLLGLVRRR